MSEVIETRNARIWLGNDGIVRCLSKPGAEETLDTAKENVAGTWKVAVGHKRPLLVNMVAQKSITKEAREYYSGDDVANYSEATALIVGSPVSRVLGEVFIRLKKTNLPVKLFTSELDAIEWLKGFIK